MLLVGVDDTDSRQGGCTTSLADGIVALFPELEPSGPARLVRLNPNVPWKTRGNGAISLQFDGACDLDDALARVLAFVDPMARVSEGAEPGVVVASRALDPALYDAAVRRVVTRAEVDAHLATAGALAAGARGVIGAAAAVAWPAMRTTWERIAYRDPLRVGLPRHVDPVRLRDIETNLPTLFDTYDLVEEDIVCIPSSPCPVLWGLRGEDPHDLAVASSRLGPERPSRETLFLTNQGTDDHLQAIQIGEATPLDSARIRCRVAARPIERGGHVFIEVEDATGRLRAAAYAPTRSFRSLVDALRPGDDVTLCGGIHDGPDGRATLGIEKLFVHGTAPRWVGNPTCEACGRAMKSAGRDAGYRCRPCGTRAGTPRTTQGGPGHGWHEVPSSARRHLAMPLKRLARLSHPDPHEPRDGKQDHPREMPAA